MLFFKGISLELRKELPQLFYLKCLYDFNSQRNNEMSNQIFFNKYSTETS